MPRVNDGDLGAGRGEAGSGIVGDPPRFEVTIVETNSPVDAGGTIEVDVVVENVGGEGSQSVDLEVQGEED